MPQVKTVQDYNRRLEQLRESLAQQGPRDEAAEYRIGAQDLLDINVFEASELNRSLRVSATGEISMPLVGTVHAAGLTASDLQDVLENRLRQYIKDPHVGVSVSAVESHPISVLGEVSKPGVFQIREPTTLLEVLSLAQGLADDAGNQVIVMRGAGLRPGADPAGSDVSSHMPPKAGASFVPVKETTAAASTPSDSVDAQNSDHSDANQKDTVVVDLEQLLESGDPRYNVPVYPGDVVKVTRAALVYVVGAVKRPGGFVLKRNEQMTVLKALALAEGLTSTSAKRHARIIRTDASTGKLTEIPVNMGKLLAGKRDDLPLKAADIVFIPDSTTKAAVYRGSEAALQTAVGVAIWRW